MVKQQRKLSSKARAVARKQARATHNMELHIWSIQQSVQYALNGDSRYITECMMEVAYAS